MQHSYYTFVCFKWGNKYTGDHVNKMLDMLGRHMTHDFELVCITDDPYDIAAEVRCLPFWEHLRGTSGCWRRLPIFADAMRVVIAHRFMCIDLDCVILGDLAPLFRRPVDFAITAYMGDKEKMDLQLYNGSMILMDAGARANVWDAFDERKDPAMVSNRLDRVGTDQAWIREILGPGEVTFGEADGVYEAKNVGEELADGTRVVFFSGPRSPETSLASWAMSNYH